MREIKVSQIQETLEYLIEKANFELPGDVLKCLQQAAMYETSLGGREILNQIIANAEIAASNHLPLCQDCGLTIVFIDIGQEVLITGGDLKTSVNTAVHNAYSSHFLRSSVVFSPLNRVNTEDNTPAVLHCNIVPGDKIHLAVLLKGGGCENMSYLQMLTPAEGKKGIEKFIIESVYKSQANPCPPVIVGVGIGGDFEYAACLAKRALLREIGSTNPDQELAGMEEKTLRAINLLGIGPQGLGGITTALAVHIQEAPCHIASLPVAVNIECHSHRHKEAII